MTVIHRQDKILDMLVAIYEGDIDLLSFHYIWQHACLMLNLDPLLSGRGFLFRIL